MKRIIICADGTWNRPEQNLAKDAPTNVLKVARAIKPVHESVEQVVFYDWGVGSYYDPGDELYFFGFSRGAYMVRSLAGFIRN